MLVGDNSKIVKTNHGKLVYSEFHFPNDLAALSPVAPNDFAKLGFATAILQQESDGTASTVGVAHENLVFNDKM